MSPSLLPLSASETAPSPSPLPTTSKSVDPTDESWTPRFASASRDARKQKSARRFEPVEIEDPSREIPQTSALPPPDVPFQNTASQQSKTAWIVTSGVLLLLIAGGLTWFFSFRHVAVPAKGPVALVIGSMNNRTGDDTLGSTIVAGLRFDLEQSAALSVRNGVGYTAALRLAGRDDTSSLTLDDARHAAHAAGAGVILFGELAPSGDGYNISLRAYDTVTGTRSMEVSETAASREQIVDALDRLAIDTRSGLGESGDSISRSSVPLLRDATSNLDALEAYASGDKLARGGHYMDGIAALEHAVSLDPHFPQAYMRLAELYRRQHAEVAGAAAALNAQLSSSTASTRIQALAQAAQAIETTGDIPAAADLYLQVTRAYPGDLESARQLALAQRLEGKYSDALATAQAILKVSPLDEEAAGTAEVSMIALDRVDAAAQLEQQSQNVGQQHVGISILIDYLHAPAGNSTPAQLSGSVDRLAAHAYAASVLDAQGQTVAGLAKWKGIVDRSSSEPALASSASYALSQAALNRALAADCPTSQSLVHQAKGLPAGPYTLHALGMAAALCGDLDTTRSSLAALTAKFPQDFAAKSTYIPNLTALVQWKTGDPRAALQTLNAARQSDLFSLTPLLQGLILLSLHQGQLAIIEFQAMLLHRGATTLIDALAYPVSQIGLARAYLDTGDIVNSTAAYKKFLLQWSKADASSPMILEARQHAHETAAHPAL